MPTNDDWISTRIARTVSLIFAIIAGSLIGNSFLGDPGTVIGAFVGFIIAIEISRRSR